MEYEDPSKSVPPVMTRFWETVGNPFPRRPQGNVSTSAALLEQIKIYIFVGTIGRANTIMTNRITANGRSFGGMVGLLLGKCPERFHLVSAIGYLKYWDNRWPRRGRRPRGGVQGSEGVAPRNNVSVRGDICTERPPTSALTYAVFNIFIEMASGTTRSCGTWDEKNRGMV